MLICPICKTDLVLKNKSYFCSNGHCFDLSKKGYVNLLMSQASTKKIHGDDKSMSLGRREFLNKGYYDKLLDEISKIVCDRKNIVDIGCGEGYYTCGVYNRCHCEKAIGIDISKDIISLACSRVGEDDIVFAVAGCNKVPVKDHSADALLSVFAPIDANECLRILKSNGIIIRVTPGINHLIELKNAVYDNPLLNQAVDLTLEKFIISSQTNLIYKFIASNNDLKNLFMMTPYYYKTSEKDKNKLNQIDSLEITADFVITVYKKEG